MKHLIFGFLIIVFLFFSRCQSLSEDTAGLLYYSDSDGSQQKVKTAADWEKKREQILEGMEEAMGELPTFGDLPPFDI